MTVNFNATKSKDLCKNFNYGNTELKTQVSTNPHKLNQLKTDTVELSTKTNNITGSKENFSILNEEGTIP